MDKIFSIIVPVYNVENYLDRCVKSLLEQRFDKYEIILVDDGSKDRSGSMCDWWSRQDSKIIALHKDNGGLSSARNFGLDRAEGDYIIFCDSDDWVDDDFLPTVYKALRNFDVDILKYGFKKYCDGVIIKQWYPCFKEGIYDKKQIAEIIIPGLLGPQKIFDYSKNPIVSAWSCVYSRKFLSDNNLKFMSERVFLNEDELFNLKAMLVAESVRVIHAMPYCYDTRENSLTQRYMPYMLEKKMKLLRKVRQQLEENNVFEKFEMYYYNYCIDNFYECVGHECRFDSEKLTIVTKRIKMILDNDLLKISLKKCNHDNMSLKSKIIYAFFRFKLSYIVLLSYRAITRATPTQSIVKR